MSAACSRPNSAGSPASSAGASFSGTVEQTSDLGLPDVSSFQGQGGAGDATSDALGLLTGSHTAKVFVDGTDKQRVQVVEDLAERDDILSMLVAARHEDGSPMSDAEIRDELLTLLVAGHETTATALSWAMERLTRHPEKLGRLRDEVGAGE